MYTSFAVISSIAAVAQATTYGFGPAFSTGPVSSTSWIRESNTTLVLPAVPSPAVDRLALWPGMGTSNGDLVQALAVSFSDPASNCGAKAGQWCLTDALGTQLGGTMVPADEGDHILIHYKYNDSTSKTDQTVSINGDLVSTLSTSSGHAQGWGTAVECQDDACSSTVPAHEYLDTVILLDSADADYSSTLGLTDATTSGFSSSDGGKTWKVTTISIEEHTFSS
ncbi:hypothetical protein MBLNU459_g5553t1 [Dothideomycetes sp. NU459]